MVEKKLGTEKFAEILGNAGNIKTLLLSRPDVLKMIAENRKKKIGWRRIAAALTEAEIVKVGHAWLERIGPELMIEAEKRVSFQQCRQSESYNCDLIQEEAMEGDQKEKKKDFTARTLGIIRNSPGKFIVVENQERI